MAGSRVHETRRIARSHRIRGARHPSSGTRLRVSSNTAEYDAEVVIFAAPTFLAPYIVEDSPPAHEFVYSPWLTANLTMDRMPRRARESNPLGTTCCYDSPALGYVVATHMSLRTRIERSVWTWYWAMADGEPAGTVP